MLLPWLRRTLAPALIGLLFLFFRIAPALAASELLVGGLKNHIDLRDAMGPFFQKHFLYQEMNKKLLKRSLRIFLEQIDRHKLYFLKGEVQSLLQVDSVRLATALAAYQEGSMPMHESIIAALGKNILRAKACRAQIKAEALDPAMVLAWSDLMAHEKKESRYALHEGELLEAYRRHFIQFWQREKAWCVNQEGINNRSFMEKAVALWDQRLQSLEIQAGFMDEWGSFANLLPFKNFIAKALAKSLDAHSAYFTLEEAQVLKTNLTKQFEGTGLVLRECLDSVRVAMVLENSPAGQTGMIKEKDALIAIDDIPTCTMNYPEVIKKFKMQEKPIKLTFCNEHGEEFSLFLSRELFCPAKSRIKISTQQCLNGNIVVISLSSFYDNGAFDNCATHLRKSLQALSRQGPIQGIILDLRNNLGGFLTQAVKMASVFMGPGLVLTTQDANNQTRQLRSLDPRLIVHAPLVIVVSKKTASAAEIMAQTLQDYEIAYVVGDQRTYGKGSVQTQTITADREPFFKVTTSLYYTPSGITPQLQGVRPNIVIPTQYHRAYIGERYLDYPLVGGRLPTLYGNFVETPVNNLVESHRLLSSVNDRSPDWFLWLPKIKRNSEKRIEKNNELQKMSRGEVETLIGSDATLEEALNVLWDMIFFEKKHHARKVMNVIP